MCDDTYSFELYRFDHADITGHVSVEITPDGVTVEDYTIGPGVEKFFGRDEHELDVRVTRAGAKEILKANGIIPGPFPAEKLGLRLAEVFNGKSDAASKFVEMAEEAGVEPEIWCR